MKFNKGKSKAAVALNSSDKPEVIIILANHNPRSKKLNAILSDHQFDAYDKSQHFDLRFYISSFAGYGLHTDCMLTVSQFRELLKSKNAEQARSSPTKKRGLISALDVNNI
jgi:predicted sugar kinase